MEKKKEKKFEMIIRNTRNIITEYTINLTIRQVYYRLVSLKLIENNRSEYVYFDKILTEIRQKDLVLANYFDDKTRQTIQKIEIDLIQDKFFSEKVNESIESIKKNYPYVLYFPNDFQKVISVILLEKQALEGIFVQSLEHLSGYILVVAKGFNSFTQMLRLKQLISEKGNKRILKLYTFGDFDDTGKLIKSNFVKQCKEFLGLEFSEIQDVALTENQIKQYNLPTNPTIKKGKTKSTHTIHLEKTNENLKFFVELDSLEPKILTTLIQNIIKSNFDFPLCRELMKVNDIRDKRFKKAYIRKLRKVDFSNL